MILYQSQAQISNYMTMSSTLMNQDLITAGFGTTEPKKGLTVITAIFFIVGEIAGTGILALPHAMAGTGKQAIQ